jgi:nucleotidyltransferase/DNA polymerase involved in DNA repair
MKAQQARVLCPDASIQEFDHSPFQEMDEAIETELSVFTTQMEGVWGFGHVGKKKRPDQLILPGSTAIFYLDLGKLRPSHAIVLAQQMLRTLRDDFRLCSSVGLARGKFPALIAARVTHPEYPKLIAPGEEKTFLAPYSITTLPLNRESSRRLEMFGIRTLGTFATLRGADVLTQFGKEGRVFHEWARGNDPRPVTSRPRKPSERLRESFDGAVEDRLVLEGVLERMGCDFEERFAASGMTTGKLELLLHLDNGKTLKAHQVLRAPTQDGRFIGRQLIRLLRQITYTCEVSSLEAIAHDLALPAMRQLGLFEQAPSQYLGDVLDNLSNRSGPEHLYRIADLDSTHWLTEYRYVLEPVA